MIEQTAEFIAYGLASAAALVIVQLILAGLSDTIKDGLVAIFGRFW